GLRCRRQNHKDRAALARWRPLGDLLALRIYRQGRQGAHYGRSCLADLAGRGVDRGALLLRSAADEEMSNGFVSARTPNPRELGGDGGVKKVAGIARPSLG